MSRVMQILPLLIGAMVSEGMIDVAPRHRPTTDRRDAERDATAAALREERRRRKFASWEARQPREKRKGE